MQAAPLRVLITNNTAGVRAGSELHVLELALGLLRRGHRPVVYSTVLGDVAEALRRATVPVVDDLTALSFVPDVIHGQHHLEAMTAALHFAGVPMVYACHGWMPWEETPPVHPAIRRYIAVDDLCAERLLTTPGIDATRVRTLYNGVDLARFHPRDPLPATPGRALIFSNYADAGNYASVIRAACARAGIARVDVVGLGAGQASDAPETLLGAYDVVFAKARCALEAMAVGCATMVADRAGLGGLVTTENFDRLRALNFGVRTMQASPVTEEAVRAALAGYDAADAARVSARVRDEAGFDAVVDATVALYREAMAEGGDVDAAARTRAAAGYLRALSPVLKSVERATREARAAEAERNIATHASESLRAGLAQTYAQLHEGEAARSASTARTDAQLREGEAARAALHAQVEQEAARANALSAAQDASARDAAASATARAALEARLVATQSALEALQVELAAAQAGLDTARDAQSELHRSRAWRAIQAYRRLRARLS